MVKGYWLREREFKLGPFVHFSEMGRRSRDGHEDGEGKTDRRRPEVTFEEDK